MSGQLAKVTEELACLRRVVETEERRRLRQRARARVRRATGRRWLKRGGLALAIVVPVSAAAAAFDKPIAAFATGDVITADAFNTLFDSLYAAVNTLDADVDAVDLRADGLDTRLSAAETGVAGLDTRLTTAETDVAGLVTRADTSDTTVSAIDGRLTSAETAVANLTTADMTHDASLTSLDGRVVALEADNQTIAGILTVEGDLDAKGDVLVASEVVLAPDARVVPDGFMVTNGIVHTPRQPVAKHVNALMNCAGMGANICTVGQYRRIGTGAYIECDASGTNDGLSVWLPSVSADACLPQMVARTVGATMQPCPTSGTNWTIEGFLDCTEANTDGVGDRVYMCCYGG